MGFQWANSFHEHCTLKMISHLSICVIFSLVVSSQEKYIQAEPPPSKHRTSTTTAYPSTQRSCKGSWTSWTNHTHGNRYPQRSRQCLGDCAFPTCPTNHTPFPTTWPSSHTTQRSCKGSWTSWTKYTHGKVHPQRSRQCLGNCAFPTCPTNHT